MWRGLFLSQSDLSCIHIQDTQFLHTKMLPVVLSSAKMEGPNA